MYISTNHELRQDCQLECGKTQIFDKPQTIFNFLIKQNEPKSRPTRSTKHRDHIEYYGPIPANRFFEPGWNQTRRLGTSIDHSH